MRRRSVKQSEALRNAEAAGRKNGASNGGSHQGDLVIEIAQETMQGGDAPAVVGPGAVAIELSAATAVDMERDQGEEDEVEDDVSLGDGQVEGRFRIAMHTIGRLAVMLKPRRSRQPEPSATIDLSSEEEEDWDCEDSDSNSDTDGGSDSDLDIEFDIEGRGYGMSTVGRMIARLLGSRREQQ